MDGIPALDLWDLVIEVFHISPNQSKKTKGNVQGDSSRNTTPNKHTQNQTMDPIHHDNLELSNVDFVSSNAKSSQFGAMLYILEGDEAVLKNDHQMSKSKYETCIQGPELLFIGCLAEVIRTPRFKSSMSNPNTNLQTC